LVTEAGSVLDDRFHDEGGGEALDAGKSGEALIVELLEGGQVGGDNAQEVVGLAEEPLGSKVRPRVLASRWAW
jgi:hypothetical protein